MYGLAFQKESRKGVTYWLGYDKHIQDNPLVHETNYPTFPFQNEGEALLFFEVYRRIVSVECQQASLYKFDKEEVSGRVINLTELEPYFLP